jgi:hypothetical protein
MAHPVLASGPGSGGGDLSTTGATVSGPEGVAIDPVSGRIYWANSGTGKISYTKLDGTGGGNLPTGAVTVSQPEGVAIDPGAGRIYWANATANKISYANLDGSGGGDLATPYSASSGFPALLRAPSRRRTDDHRWLCHRFAALLLARRLGTRSSASVPLPGAADLRLPVEPRRLGHRRRDRQLLHGLGRRRLPLPRNRLKLRRQRRTDKRSPRHRLSSGADEADALGTARDQLGLRRRRRLDAAERRDGFRP